MMAKKETLSSLKKKCDAWFSKFIRLRDSDDNGICTCCTCGKKEEWKHMQCGHFVPRNHLSTRFDEKNCNVQCVGCNMFKSGMQYEHGRYIDRKYGEGTADKLMEKNKSVFKITGTEYNDMINFYREESRIIADMKGINL